MSNSRTEKTLLDHTLKYYQRGRLMKTNNSTATTSRLLSTKAAAQYLAISERKLWQLSKDKRLPAVKFDRVVRYDVADLDDFIAQAKGGRS